MKFAKTRKKGDAKLFFPTESLLKKKMFCVSLRKRKDSAKQGEGDALTMDVGENDNNEIYFCTIEEKRERKKWDLAK